MAIFYKKSFTMIKIIPPSNAVIRKRTKGTPFVVHLDKLKQCYDESDPVLDLVSDTATGHLASANETPSVDSVPIQES